MLWYHQGGARTHEFERIMPDASVELVINLREDRFRVYHRKSPELSHHTRGCLISGPRSEYFVIDTAQQLSSMGVHFKPGGAFPFLGMPASELQDQQVGLEDLWGRAAGEMRERILEATTVDARLAVLEKCLTEMAPSLERHPAVQFALNEFQPGLGIRNVAEVTGQIGMSAKRFIQVFGKEVGLTPKLFCRVRRFQRVLGSIAKRQQIDWADVAVSTGYFDQAHFIHDFRAFSGLNPSAYMAQRTEHLNHVPLRD